MKDVKSYVIGFLTCACMFLIMGQTENKVVNDIKTLLTENGRYQASSVLMEGQLDYVKTTIIDTRTGEIVKKVSLKSIEYK